MPAQIDVRKELLMISKLQAIDTALQDLEDEKGDLPRLVERLKEDITARDEALSEVKDRLAEIGKEKRSIDGKNELAQMKRDKYKQQLYSVSTSREYDAINTEIDSIEAEIEEANTAKSKLSQEEESLEMRSMELDERLNELNTELDERSSELNEKLRETEEEENEYNHERDKLIVRIKKPIVAHYDRIRRAKEGIGAASIQAGACGACFAVIPPQRQSEVRKMKDLLLCESCGVILLPEEEYFEDVE